MTDIRPHSSVFVAARNTARLLLLLILPLAGPGRGRAATATLSGFVRDADSGEALAAAAVTLSGTARGAVTNDKGYYVIAGIPPGTYRIVVTHIGYAPRNLPVDLTRELELVLTVELKPQAIRLEPLEVQAGRSQTAAQPSVISLSTEDLKTVPHAVEADVFRALQALPGVSALSDFSAGLYVRGGSPDQNLILLDDIDVYNPNHLFGFFSTFNVDAVRTVELEKSGYPVRYGGRLSSLLDVHNREGNRKRVSGTGRASVIAASGTLEGPWPKGSWMVSGRHTYIAPLARAVGIDLPYKFYDLHGRANYDVDQSNHAGASWYTGKDKLDFHSSGFRLLLDWGNDTWSGQWTHVFNRGIYSHFVVGHSAFDSHAAVRFEDFSFRLQNNINDLSLKGNLSWAASSAHVLESGGEMKALDFRFRETRGAHDELTFHHQGTYAAVYLEDAWRVSDEWQARSGLRLDYYSEGSYLRPGPYVSLRRQLAPRAAVHATYGRYHQFLNLVSQTGASFAEMWFPVDQTISPGAADHYVLGLDLGPFDSWALSLETYYKPYRNLVEFSSEFARSIVTSDATMNEIFNSGHGRAYGAEFYLRNRWRGWEGWIGYALGFTERTIDGYNFGQTYNPDYDRRHQFVLMQDHGFGAHWRMNLTFRYGSGQPTSPAAGRYTVRDVNGREFDTILQGRMNTDRLPDYHRLDFSLSYHKRFRTWSLVPTLEVINVYNQRNVYIRTYDTSDNPATHHDVTMLPLLPTIGVSASF